MKKITCFEDYLNFYNAITEKIDGLDRDDMIIFDELSKYRNELMNEYKEYECKRKEIMKGE